MFVPVSVIRRRRIVHRFLRCGAISPETAITPAEAGVFAGIGFILSRLEAHGILKSSETNKYYVDTTRV